MERTKKILVLMLAIVLVVNIFFSMAGNVVNADNEKMVEIAFSSDATNITLGEADKELSFQMGEDTVKLRVQANGSDVVFTTNGQNYVASFTRDDFADVMLQVTKVGTESTVQFDIAGEKRSASGNANIDLGEIAQEGSNFLRVDVSRKLAEIELNSATAINDTSKTITYNNGTATVTSNGTVKLEQRGQQFFLTTTGTNAVFTLNPSEGNIARIWADGQQKEFENNTYTVSGLTTESNIKLDIRFEAENNGGNNNGNNNNGENNNNNNNNNNNENNNNEGHWDDGTIYFVWATEGETGNFYYHKITDIIGGGTVNYVPVSKIVDDNDNEVKFNINNRERKGKHADGQTETVQSYEFVWSDKFEKIKNDESFLNLPTTQKFDYLFENDMTAPPIGALDGANCISTMADLAFKLTIYNDEANAYEGIKVGVPSSYEYYPEFWNQVFNWDIVDVSKTTKATPAVYECFLLEKTLQLTNANFSRNIASIKALDVPEKAVKITNAGSGKWNITYSSNYYDNVELEVTDVNGQKYYIVLSRINVLIKSFNTDQARKDKYAAIYYPSTDSYKDYSVVLTINYKNGKSETKVLDTPNKGLEGENGDKFDVYEHTGGKNLKTAWYKLDGVTEGPTSDVSKFYITVVKGTNNGDNYGGTLTGAGDGVEFKNSGRGFERVYMEE